MNCTKLHYCLFPEKQFSAGDKASLTKVKFFRNNDASCLGNNITASTLHIHFLTALLYTTDTDLVGQKAVTRFLSGC